MASLSITLHWGSEEEGLVEAVAEGEGRFRAAAKVAGNDEVVVDLTVWQGEAALRHEGDADHASVSPEDGGEVEENVWGMGNVTVPMGLLGDVCSLGDWRALLNCSRIAA